MLAQLSLFSWCVGSLSTKIAKLVRILLFDLHVLFRASTVGSCKCSSSVCTQSIITLFSERNFCPHIKSLGYGGSCKLTFWCWMTWWTTPLPVEGNLAGTESPRWLQCHDLVNILWLSCVLLLSCTSIEATLLFLPSCLRWCSFSWIFLLLLRP